MKMDENTKRRRLDSSSPPLIKVEVKEENVMGNDYLMAKGRLQGVLRQLTEQSESETDDSEEETRHYRTKKMSESVRKKHDSSTPMRSTYLMKLYDRSVDLAKFEEDTPLYPICRAWIANNSKKPQTIIKRRLSSPEPDSWNPNLTGEIYRLPPPNGSFMSRVPSPTLEQRKSDKNSINLNYEEKLPISKHQLMKEHLNRWGKIKRKWISNSMKNEERYTMSKSILQEIYTKAQESMIGE